MRSMNLAKIKGIIVIIIGVVAVTFMFLFVREVITNIYAVHFL
jgi:hypothetical protein